uniref:Uncharacterized protein n=1 Tax=Rhizophora mucronata TaxID=61149 RepID=A0A2P2NHS0_RHIMU
MERLSGVVLDQIGYSIVRGSWLMFSPNGFPFISWTRFVLIINLILLQLQ